jgi:TolB-like protein/class 3 adenylate cyclase/Flp pilus assembly protein TadD
MPYPAGTGQSLLAGKSNPAYDARHPRNSDPMQERPDRIRRRLSAILAADVAGYSRLMHHHEEATHAKLNLLLVDAIEPAIAEHGGHIVKHTGDGFLAEFPSAVEAVRAAMRFQSGILEVTTGDSEDERIAFRVGINVGDVIVEAHDIFGDEVNIAVRLEGIAAPGGICLSSSAYDHVRGRVPLEFTDLGEQSLRNITRPVRAYAVAGVGLNGSAHRNPATPDSVHRLSIVVLPFDNMGGEPGQDYFVDGITESLTTDLSRIAGSFVIARNTAFTFKGKAVDVKKLGRELNVSYVLEGSVQRSDRRLRVNVQLIDAETGNHVWAERFDKPVADLFDMQDEIVSRLANTLNSQLVEVEARRAELLPRPDVMALIFQGSSFWNKGSTPEHMARALGFFERALELDPLNVEAMVNVAAVHAVSAALYLVDDRKARFAKAETILNKALSIAPQHARAHMFLGITQLSTNRAALGISECERALALNRNLADAHGAIGVAKIFIGRGEETETHIQEALRLSPRDDSIYRWLHYVGVAKLQLGVDAEAVVWLRRCLEANRNYPIAHFHLAAALARIGSLDEARATVKAGLALDPNFTIQRMRGITLSDNPVFRAGSQRIREGMRLAEVPEE